MNKHTIKQITIINNGSEFKVVFDDDTTTIWKANETVVMTEEVISTPEPTEPQSTDSDSSSSLPPSTPNDAPLDASTPEVPVEPNPIV